MVSRPRVHISVSLSPSLHPLSLYVPLSLCSSLSMFLSLSFSSSISLSLSLSRAPAPSSSLSPNDSLVLVFVCDLQLAPVRFELVRHHLTEIRLVDFKRPAPPHLRFNVRIFTTCSILPEVRRNTPGGRQTPSIMKVV